MAIGRGLGDSFAWFFYQFDRDYLLEHAKQPENALLPTGLGGQGEVGFIKRTQFVGRLFVLYHGITSVLRLGDVSLVDMKRLRVAAIGELKTVKKNAPEEIRVTLVFKGSKKRLKIGRLRRVSGLEHDLPAVLKDRLRVQLKRIDSALESAEARKAGVPLGGIASDYVRVLGRLLQSNKRSRFGFAQAGPGLVLTAYRTGTRSLYGRLNRKPTASGLPDRDSVVAGLVLAGSPYNRLLLGVVHYGGEGFNPRLLVGTIPPFWWGLEPETLRPLMLGEAVVMTLYNPAHLAKALQEVGFEVAPDSSAAGFAVRRTWGDGFLAVENFDYFLTLIRFCLFSEAQVTEIITNGIKAVARRGLLRPGNRITWQFNHLLLRPSWRSRPKGDSEAT